MVTLMVSESDYFPQSFTAAVHEENIKKFKMRNLWAWKSTSREVALHWRVSSLWWLVGNRWRSLIAPGWASHQKMPTSRYLVQRIHRDRVPNTTADKVPHTNFVIHKGTHKVHHTNVESETWTLEFTGQTHVRPPRWVMIYKDVRTGTILGIPLG